MAPKKQPHNAGLLTAVTFAALAVAGYLVFQHFAATSPADPAGHDEIAEEEHFIDRFAPANAIRQVVPRQPAASASAGAPSPATPSWASSASSPPAVEEIDPIDQQSREHGSKGAIVGRPSILSSHSFVLQGRAIVLEGIRVPWDRSICQQMSGKPYCTASSLLSLRTIIGLHEIACYDHGTDGLGRMIGTCFAGVIDIASAMVRDGWAVNDSARKYAPQESDARFKHKGLWQGSFDPRSFTE